MIFDWIADITKVLKDYTVHCAQNTFVKNDDYHVKKIFVLSNTCGITTNGKITYLPIYDVMFLGADMADGKKAL